MEEHVLDVRFGTMMRWNGWRLLLFASVAASLAISRSAQDGTAVLKSLSNPMYPPLARMANVSGDVRVVVSLRRDGTIASATVLSGPLMLREAALESAQHSVFDCYACVSDKSYLLVYKFEQLAGDDCCTASAVAPKVEQAGTSHDEQGRLAGCNRCRANLYLRPRCHHQGASSLVQMPVSVEVRCPMRRP